MRTMRPNYPVAILLVLITLGVFSRVPGHQFLTWGDRGNVWGNPHLLPPTGASLDRFWTGPYLGSYIPVTRTLWALLAQVSLWVAPGLEDSPLNPAVFHAANVIVHAVSALVVFVILRRLLRREWAAFAGALLFALHPAQAQPIAWVSGMKDLLGALFALLALWQYVAYAQASRGEEAVARRRVYYGVATLCFALALLSNPGTAAVPLMALALDRWGVKRSWRRALAAAAPWLLLAVPLAVVAWWAEQGAPYAPADVPVWGRLVVAGDALAFHLGKFVLPLGLAPDYARTPERVLASASAYVAWAVPVALGVAVWRYRLRWPWLTPSATVFTAGLLPVLGLVPFVAQAHSTVADRYLYLAMLGPALAVAWVYALRRPRWFWTACWLVMAALAALSVLEVRHWRDDQAFYAHALDMAPASWLAHGGLGRLLVQEGRADEAIPHVQAAARIHPASDTYRDLGNALWAVGRTDEAIVAYSEAVSLAPDEVDVRVLLGSALARVGRTQDAIAQLQEALRLQPDRVETRQTLALALSADGQVEEAIRHLQIVVAARPDDAKAHYYLGANLVRAGRIPQAIDHLGVALRIQPDQPAARQLLNRVLRALEAQQQAQFPDTGP